MRPRDANPVAYAGLYTAELQHAAYSDIEPDDTNSSPQEAYDAAMKVITKRKWHVVDARPPQAAAARADAGARTLRRATASSRRWRARRSSASARMWRSASVPTHDGARIDVRSASRYGRNDLGNNAARVRKLIDDIDDVLSPPEPDKKAPPQPRSAGGQGRFGQAVGAADRRRALGRDDAARDQILEMRQHRQRRRRR